jgi:hypothetical protein
VVPSVYLADVFARPVSVLASDRAVRVAATIDAGAVGGNHDVTVTAELLTSAGAKRAEATAKVRLAGPGTRTVTLTIDRLGDVDYWSPQHPALYAVGTTLSNPGGGSHTVTTRIGFRQADFKTGGFFLNGSRYEIFGLNRHQIFPYLGMAAPARLQRRDALTLKNDLNVNMVRCSHYPQSPHFLDACRLSLALADAEIAGDGSDATAVSVRVTDAYGNHRPGTAGGVALTLAGPATLIAANPFPLAALGGVGGGFIRSRPGTAGRVTLTATHAALGRAQVGLTVTSVRSKTFI